MEGGELSWYSRTILDGYGNVGEHRQWVGVIGDVLHDVGLESGLSADFLCNFGPLLTALVVVGSPQNRQSDRMDCTVLTVAWSPHRVGRRHGRFDAL